MNDIPEIKSEVNERLKSNCPNIDLSKEPPISQKRLVTFINNFVINIVEFVDKFSRHCTYKLFTFQQKINKIEAELCLLESKLNSIPEVSNEKDVNVILPKPEELGNCGINNSEFEKDSSVTVKVNDNIPDLTEKECEEITKPDVVSKYRKMMQVGVPVEAVKMKMQIEGLDPSLLG